MLHQLAVSWAVSSAALPFFVAALWRSFAVMPLGAFLPTESGALAVAALVGNAMAAALALGAPVAGATLAAETAAGLVGRIAPGAKLQELAAPVRLLLGTTVLWVGFSFVAERVLSELAQMPFGLLEWLRGSS
jgi:flagellar biosynthesis protein FliR